jgi:hypothetical protein
MEGCRGVVAVVVGWVGLVGATCGEDLVEKDSEFFEAGAWDDDGVASPVGFFGDAQEASAFIFAEFDKEVFAFDLEVARFDDIFHGSLLRLREGAY